MNLSDKNRQLSSGLSNTASLHFCHKLAQDVVIAWINIV